jgi:hypothetical protein
MFKKYKLLNCKPSLSRKLNSDPESMSRRKCENYWSNRPSRPKKEKRKNNEMKKSVRLQNFNRSYQPKKIKRKLVKLKSEPQPKK